MAEINLLEKELTRDLFVDLLMPEWADCKEINISILSGGITNKLYRVTSEKGDLAVRIYGDKTEMFINRDYEAETMQKVSEIGISPKMIKYLPEYHVTIVEFITHGYTLKNKDFLRDELREKIVNPIRRLHDSSIKLPRVFNPLKEVKKMDKILKDLNASYPEFDIAGTIDKLEKLDEKLGVGEGDYTSCHNDLLAENFILIKEGYEDKYEEPLYIIDWEYAGMAPRYYDIADMFQEVLIGRDLERKYVEAYCKGDLDVEDAIYQIEMYKPYPDIFWFLWSLIQQNISTIEFDFYNYGKVKYENAQKNLEFLKDRYGVKY